ncbi:MAG: sigma-70 family RNA polymerase sigma factor [bacterium]|nr:sigma-70 family RNA polymerase sigma factor [bacterium]
MDEDLGSSARQQAEPHTLAEVERAISDLDPRGMERLQTAARDSVRRYGLGNPVHDPEDLLSEAFLRLLSGARSWRRGIGFEYQMARVMDSIASDWRRRGASNPEIREVELSSPDGGDEDAPGSLPDPRSPERSMEDCMVAADEAQEVAKLFADDPEALRVLECLYLELTRREMRQRTRMSEKQLEAAIRRLRRGAERWRAGLG